MRTKNILSVLMAVLMLSSVVSTASAYEVRGTVSDGTTKVWDTKNFAGFYYDINNDLGAETLTIDGAEDVTDRVISEDKLTYTTAMVPVTFEYSKDKSKPVYDTTTQYNVVGWQAEKWVALNGKANKLVKLITEFKGTEKVTLSSGATLDLGKGYVMKIQSVDARAAPRQAWIQLLKDGTVLDDGILQQDGVYNFRKTVGGEQDALVFSAYVSSIFSGTEVDMIQLQYLWLIDESSFTEIKNGDKFGVFEVTGITPAITLQNSGTVSLSRNTDTILMGNMKFKIADNSALRFYPYVDITTDTVKVEKTTSTVTPKVTVTPVITASPCIPEIIYKNETIYITPTPTPVPTVVITPKPAPGFSGIFAIVGLLFVVFLVLRQKQ